MLRVDVSAAVKAGPHFTVLGEVRSENVGRSAPYALYLRIRPWTARNFDIQVGRVPPTFGAFARRTYAADNPLIGYPLAYQYLTTMRADALAGQRRRAAAEARHAAGCFAYSVGQPAPARGVPLVSAFRWDTGVQVHASDGPRQRHGVGHRRHAVEPALSRRQQRPAGGRTRRAASGRRAGRRRLAGARAVPRPGGGARRIGDVADGHDEQFTQTAWGGDVEYSRDYYLIRFETVVSEWRLPAVGAPALPRRSARSRRRSRAATSCGRASTPPRGSITWGSATIAGTRRDAAVGRAGDPRRGRRRLLAPAQPAAEALVSAQHAATAARWRESRTWPPRSSSSGSDEKRPRTQRAQRTQRACASPRAAALVLAACACCLCACSCLCVLCPVSCPLWRGRSERRRRSRRRDPGPRRGPPRRHPDGAAARRRRSRHAAADAACRIAAIGRLPGVGAARRVRAERAGRAVMDQRNETFVPHVLAITTGTTVDFPNSDRFYHNVFSLSKTKRVRPRALRGRQVASRSASIARASSACSATSIRT